MQSGALTKAAAENSVLLVQRWILARLRDQTFFELGALNRAIRVLLDALNDRPLKKLGVSRRVLYEQLDRPALRPLPATRYVLARWKRCRVNILCGLPPYVVSEHVIEDQSRKRAVRGHITCGVYNARRNAMSPVSSRQRFVGRSSCTSQSASALAFISRSTSA